MEDTLKDALDALKASLDEHTNGGKTVEQNLHSILTQIHGILAILSGHA